MKSPKFILTIISFILITIIELPIIFRGFKTFNLFVDANHSIYFSVMIAVTLFYWIMLLSYFKSKKWTYPLIISIVWAITGVTLLSLILSKVIYTGDSTYLLVMAIASLINIIAQILYGISLMAISRNKNIPLLKWHAGFVILLSGLLLYFLITVSSEGWLLTGSFSLISSTLLILHYIFERNNTALPLNSEEILDI